MRQGRWDGLGPRWRPALLLAALLVSPATVRGAAAPSRTGDFDFVPTGADGLVVLRPALIAHSLGARGRTERLPWGEAWEKALAVPFQHVDRCIVVLPSGKARGLLWIIRSARPYDRNAMLKAYAGDLKVEALEGKVCFVRGADGPSFRFVNNHVLLIADSKAILERCLKSAPTAHLGGRPFADAARQSGDHHAVAWSRVRPLDDGVNYEAPLLGEVPLPLLASVKWATLTLDVGKQIDLRVRVHCADEHSAAKVVGPVRAVLDLLRMQVSMGLAMQSMTKLAAQMPGKNGLGDLKDFPNLPTRLLRQGEKALRRARVRAEGNSVGVSVALALSGPAVRSDLVRLMAVVEGKNGGAKHRAGGVVTAGDRRATGAPPAVVRPVEGPRPPAPASPYSPAFPPPGATLPQTTPPSAWAGHGPHLPPPPAISPPPLPLPAPGPVMPVSTFPQPPAFAPAPALMPVPVPVGGKLTVANLRKETALLFRKEASGKLTFVRKLPSGAVDEREAAPGQSWVAVFPDTPGGETFTVRPGAVWVLR